MLHTHGGVFFKKHGQRPVGAGRVHSIKARELRFQLSIHCPPIRGFERVSFEFAADLFNPVVGAVDGVPVKVGRDIRES